MLHDKRRKNKKAAEDKSVKEFYVVKTITEASSCSFSPLKKVSGRDGMTGSSMRFGRAQLVLF